MSEEMEMKNIIQKYKIRQKEGEEIYLYEKERKYNNKLCSKKKRNKRENRESG